MDVFKIGILESDHFSEKAMAALRSIGEVDFFENDESRLGDFIRDKDAIFVRLKYNINDSLFSEAGSLKYVCSPTTGLNHINVSDQYKIISLKGEYEFLRTICATPEHVFGLVLALLRNYNGAFRNKERFSWDRDSYRGYELYQNKVGIIGMGRIGKILSRYFKAFDAEVYYCDIEDKGDSYGIKCFTLEELCEKANIILLEADYREENEKMIGRTELGCMKGKYFVNAARGELVDEEELIKMIEEDAFAGVAIDVISNETSKANNLGRFVELTECHNLILTSHIGGATYTSMERTEEFIAEKLVEEVRNHRL